MDDLSVVTVIAIALGFDFVNGFPDAANSIATVVVDERALAPPRRADHRRPPAGRR